MNQPLAGEITMDESDTTAIRILLDGHHRATVRRTDAGYHAFLSDGREVISPSLVEVATMIREYLKGERDAMKETPLSIVQDTMGHTIERFPGDVLRVTHTKTGQPVSLEEHAKVASWFWAYVAVHGNDPAPLEPPIKASPNRSSIDGWPHFPGDSDR